MTRRTEAGFTLVEIIVTITVFMVVSVSLFGLFTSLMRSTVLARRQAVASGLATNRMEQLKALPYDSLAVAGGSIYSASPLPATADTTLNGTNYRTTTSINFVDDAYDGCASYPNETLQQRYCRNLPAPSGAPAVDSNPQDYKVVHVAVTDKRSGTRLAQTDTQVSARVSETASTTGALFVTVLDDTGNKVAGANINVKNTTLAPVADLNDSSDSNGTAIFYGLKPDAATDYVITASKSGYSTLATINSSGSLQPTYPNQKVITQQSSFVTLSIRPMNQNSLAVEAVGTNGAALANVKLALKGGDKKYVSSSDTAYYYDNQSPSDVRPATAAGGLATITGLTPGPYWLCGDDGTAGCSVGGTTYYVAAVVPYGGSTPFGPVAVPSYDSAAPTYEQGGAQYAQKVRAIMTSDSTFPRVQSMTPGSASKGDASINNVAFTLRGANLPCSAVAGSCATTVTFKQGAASYPASCTGDSGGAQLSCTVNLAAANGGNTSTVITSGGKTLTVPGDTLVGGVVLVP